MIMLTEPEIKKIKEKAITITLNDVFARKVKPVNPTIVSNGYRVSMSIEALRDYLDVHHVSVLNPKGVTDPAEAEHIAKDILGEGYQFITQGELVPNNLHFMKVVIKEGKARK